MDRENIRDQIRLISLVEGVHVTDAEVNALIDEGLQVIAGYYPFSVNIVDLATDAAEPAFDDAFHWLAVEWPLAQIFKREEYYDVADLHEQKFEVGVRRLIKFYTGGRT